MKEKNKWSLGFLALAIVYGIWAVVPCHLDVARTGTGYCVFDSGKLLIFVIILAVSYLFYRNFFKEEKKDEPTDKKDKDKSGK